jgi:hypothetical protein
MIILPSTLGIMLLVLVCRFGRAGLRRLAHCSFQGGILAFGACLAQMVSVLTHLWRFELLLVTATLLAIFCWLNRRQIGIPIATIGIALNLLVMGANGGTMPVNPTTLVRMSGLDAKSGTALYWTKDRVLADDQASLSWLGDRLLLPGRLRYLAAWSIGDVLILTGIGLLLWHTMKGCDDDERMFWREAAPSGIGATDLCSSEQSALRLPTGSDTRAGSSSLRAWPAALANGVGPGHID